MMVRMRVPAALAVAVGGLGVAVAAMAQGHHDHGAARQAPPPSRTITMEELHRSGGVPRGWKFTLPSGGDAAKGQKLFAELECFKCHARQGAAAPPSGADRNVGPDLSSMGGHHPAEYFAESIIAPNHVIVEGPGWVGPDGRSIMPSYADSLSVTQLLDLVAFIKSQDGGEDRADHGHGIVHERVVGPYRVRLEFKAPDHASGSHPAAHGQSGVKGGGTPKAAEHHHHHGGGQAGHGDRAGATGHLVAFVTDATTGDAIPYLPVSAVIQGAGVPPRTIKLAPMLGSAGFHYGANTTLPARTQKVVLSIGAPTIPVMGGDRRFGRAHTVPFDWSTPPR